MKSIIVKNKNSVSCYMSPVYSGTFNTETGERTETKLTDEEEEQSCYQSLIRDVKRKEFEKHLIFLIGDYFGDIENWTNIKVEMSFSTERQAFLNVNNPDNIQWQKMELPEIEGK